MNTAFENTARMTVNGTRLAYVERGSGDSLVLVHGGVSDLRTWDKQLQSLGERYSVLAYSRRYARPNTELADGAEDPIQPHVDDLAAIIETRKHGAVHLVGHSMGGQIALFLAIQRPELVRKLVLIEPPVIGLIARMPPSFVHILQMLIKRPRSAMTLARFRRRVMKPAELAFRQGDDKAAIQMLGKGILGDSYFNTLSPGRYQQIWENRKADRAQILGQGYPPLRPADVSSVDHPVLLLRGSDSPKLFHRLTDRLAGLLPRARIVDIANASHILHEDKPSSVNSEILKFLDGPARERSATGTPQPMATAFTSSSM